MEVSLRAPCKADHFHFTLEKTVELKKLPREGSLYHPHWWQRLRFRVDAVIRPQKSGRIVVILEALPASRQAFRRLVDRVTAPVPIRPRRSSSTTRNDGWRELPGSRGPDLFTSDEWELIKGMC